jgi:hypothetical protein
MDFLKDIEIAPELKTTIEQQFKSYVEETTKGLKANNDALLAEKKKAQEAAEQASALAKLENEEKLKAKNVKLAKRDLIGKASKIFKGKK